MKRWNFRLEWRPYFRLVFNEGFGPVNFAIIERWWNGRSASGRGGWFVYVYLFGWRWHT